MSLGEFYSASTNGNHFYLQCICCQRRHLRKILGINWQRNITNNELYARTKCEPWSEMIRERRLTWLGHLVRLHLETPAWKAVQEYLTKVKRPQGRPKTTWMQTVGQDLARIGINLDLSKEVNIE